MLKDFEFMRVSWDFDGLQSIQFGFGSIIPVISQCLHFW